MKSTQIKHKGINKMIRRVQGGNAFSTSSIAKRLFTLVSFAVYFGLIIYVLFQIPGMPQNEVESRNIAWLSLMVVFLWQAARLSNTNLHVSFTTIYISFVFALVMNAYAVFFVLFNIHYEPTSWQAFADQYYWWIPLLAWNAIWKLMFSVLEYKARPFFGIQKLLSFITNALIIAIVVYGVHFAKKFLIEKQEFDYLEPSTFIGLALLTLGGIMVAFLLIVDTFFFAKYAKAETKSKKGIRLWTALLQVGPVAVWFIFSAIVHKSKNFEIHFGIQEWIFLGIAIFAIAFVLVTVLTRKEAGGSSRVFVVISSTSIALVVIAGYLFKTWWNSDLYANIIIMLPALVIIQIIVIITEPETPKFYAFTYQSLFTSISSYGMLLWTISATVTNSTELPFHIDDIIFIPTVVCAAGIEIISLSSYWYIVTRISKYTSKAYKLHLKGVKHE